MIKPLLDLSQKILQKNSLKEILVNSGWMFLDTALKYLGAFFIGVWVARYFGPADFGLYSYAAAFTLLFSAFAGLGLKSIVVREIVRRPDNKDEILGSSFLMMLGAGVIVWAISAGVILLVRPEDTIVQIIVLIIGASYLFKSVNVIQYYFESQVKSKFVVIAKNISFAISSILKVLMITNDLGLRAFAFISLIDSILICLCLAMIGWKKGLELLRWRWNTQVAKSLLKDSAPLIFAGLFATIFLKIDQVMIGNTLDDSEVGYYAISVKLTELWYVFPTIIQVSVFPNLMKNKVAPKVLLDKMYRLFSVLAIFSILIAIPISIFSGTIIKLLYGPEFIEAATMLSISIWALIFVCFGVARLPYLIATGNAKMSMYFGLIGASINVLLNFILIPKYGGNGAAVATLLSYGSSAYLANFLFPKCREIGRLMTKSIYSPIYRI